MTPTPGPAQVDFGANKQRQHATWASGNYAIVGTTLQIVGEHLAEAVDLRVGKQVLDVAAGNGNATLAAARRFARVTSTDYVPELLEKGAEPARANGLEVRLQAADAEDLPFADGTFDVALSPFGVMFAPDHARAARELTRVVRGGDRVGLANWTPEGFIGDLFRLIASYVPPPAGVRSPMLWGTEPRIVEQFGPDATDIRCERRRFNFRYQSAALDPDRQASLTQDIGALLERQNVGGAHSLVVPSEYLEVVVTRK